MLPLLDSFNPRAHVGRDSLNAFSCKAYPSFNPRAHVGRDTPYAVLGCGTHHVSIHAPTWGATSFILSSTSLRILFQSTRPRGARQECCEAAFEKLQFQSTRPRGARQFIGFWPWCKRPVSIHAPTWGATLALYGNAQERKQVSIHAPTWGATASCSVLNANTLFQSTRPRGARR